MWINCVSQVIGYQALRRLAAEQRKCLNINDLKNAFCLIFFLCYLQFALLLYLVLLIINFICVLLAYSRSKRHSTSGILDSPQATDHRLGMEKAVRIR